MFRDPREIAAILGVLDNHPHPTMGLFKNTYAMYFDESEVPVIQAHERSVVVDTAKATAYLKRVYNLQTTPESQKVVNDAYRDHVRGEVPGVKKSKFY